MSESSERSNASSDKTENWTPRSRDEVLNHVTRRGAALRNRRRLMGAGVGGLLVLGIGVASIGAIGNDNPASEVATAGASTDEDSGAGAEVPATDPPAVTTTTEAEDSASPVSPLAPTTTSTTTPGLNPPVQSGEPPSTVATVPCPPVDLETSVTTMACLEEEATPNTTVPVTTVPVTTVPATTVPVSPTTDAPAPPETSPTTESPVTTEAPVFSVTTQLLTALDQGWDGGEYSVLEVGPTIAFGSGGETIYVDAAGEIIPATDALAGAAPFLLPSSEPMFPSSDSPLPANLESVRGGWVELSDGRFLVIAQSFADAEIEGTFQRNLGGQFGPETTNRSRPFRLFVVDQDQNTAVPVSDVPTVRPYSTATSQGMSADAVLSLKVLPDESAVVYSVGFSGAAYDLAYELRLAPIPG